MITVPVTTGICTLAEAKTVLSLMDLMAATEMVLVKQESERRAIAEAEKKLPRNV